ESGDVLGQTAATSGAEDPVEDEVGAGQLPQRLRSGGAGGSGAAGGSRAAGGCRLGAVGGGEGHDLGTAAEGGGQSLGMGAVEEGDDRHGRTPPGESGRGEERVAGVVPR